MKLAFVKQIEWRKVVYPSLIVALRTVFLTVPAITFWIALCALLFDPNRVSQVAQYFSGSTGPARFVECVNKYGSVVLFPMTFLIGVVRFVMHKERTQQSA